MLEGVVSCLSILCSFWVCCVGSEPVPFYLKVFRIWACQDASELAVLCLHVMSCLIMSTLSLSGRVRVCCVVQECLVSEPIVSCRSCVSSRVLSEAVASCLSISYPKVSSLVWAAQSVSCCVWVIRVDPCAIVPEYVESDYAISYLSVSCCFKVYRVVCECGVLCLSVLCLDSEHISPYCVSYCDWVWRV